jgi:hypothetical protein
MDDKPDFTSYRPVFFEDRDFVYFTANNGLFRGESDGTDNNAYFKRSVLPTVRAFSAAISSDTVASGKNWFVPGKIVNLVACIVEYLDDGTPVEGPVSAVEVVENLTSPGFIQLTVSALTKNIRKLDRTYLEVYRTLQYGFGEAAPASFRQCFAAALSDAIFTASGDVISLTGLTPINLTANDDIVRSSPEIYTSPNAEGGAFFVNLPIPAAQDVTTWKGYALYGGLRTPPFTEVQMTGLPADAGTDTFVFGFTSSGTDVSVALSSFANSSSLSTTTGQLTLADMTFKGKSSSTRNLSIRIIDPKATTAPVECGVPWVARTAFALSRTVGANTAAVVRIIASPGDFDLAKFESPKGAFAVVDGRAGSLGIVRDVVTYDDFEQIPTSDRIEFYGCQSKTGFTVGGTGAFVWDTAPGSGEHYYIYPLSTQSTENLPLFALSATASNAQDLSLSLAPTFFRYPAEMHIDKPVATAGGMTLASRRLVCTPNFLGILWRAAPERLDRSVKKLVKDFNAARDAFEPYAVYTGEPYRFTLVGMLGGTHTGTGNKTNSGSYDALFLSSTGSVKFDLPITTVASNQAEEVDRKNCVAFSKLGRPECMPLTYTIAPTAVGSASYPVQRIAVNQDQLYVFKEVEGIYRVQIIEGGVLPEIASISTFDNTIFLAAKYSLQEVQESLYFLSNKGVMQINNGSMTNVSRSIESEIKNALSKETSTDAILSFKNEFRRQYGIHFPTSGVTYVLDTFLGTWSKWAVPFTANYATKTGQLYLTKNTVVSGASTTAAVTTRELNTAGWDNPADQYDWILPVTSVDTGNSCAFTSGTPAPFTSAYYLALLTGVSTGSTKVYYRDGSNVLYPVTYVSADSGAGSVTFSFDGGISKPAGSGSLVIGVNASVTLNRFWAYSSAGQAFDGRAFPGSGQGASTLTQFTEQHLHVAGTHHDVDVRFEADSYSPAFASTYRAVLPTFQEVIRIGVPRQAARGRWIMSKIAHSYPFEKFALAGFSYIFKDLDTHRVKVKGA